MRSNITASFVARKGIIKVKICKASEVCMWNFVDDNKKERVLFQLDHLSKIMDSKFSGILFRNALDYIFSQALLPEGSSPRWVTRNYRAIMPRTQGADEILRNNNGFNASRKHIKVEHITSVKTLGLRFTERDFDLVASRQVV